jgi:carbon starvation protein
VRPEVNQILIITIIALVLFWLGYRFYARYICSVFGEDNTCPTPAVTMEDGVDYVPTRGWVVFGHHFASIAGAGPIIGPAWALIYGWLPCVLWVVIGTIVIGAVHDLSVLMTSIREKGRSVAEVARDAMGTPGFFLLIAFTLLIVLLVCANFLNATATALTSKYPLAQMGLGPDQQVFRTVTEDGVVKGIVGGIASTSAIVITVLAPLVGFLLYRRKISPVLASIIAIVGCTLSIIIGINWPVTLTPNEWKIVLTVYTFFAAGVPVWIILQPRDFTNSFILYAGIIALVIGSVIAGIKGVPMQLPPATISEGTQSQGPLWPMLFILIACGACSGFHALVAGGTSAKQICSECDIRPIGYGAMVAEGLLALTVIIAIAVGLSKADYMSIVYSSVVASRNPILAFAVGMGNLLKASVGVPMYYGTIFGVIMVEGFIATTLDTAVRLCRYLFEELWRVIIPNTPTFMKSYYFNAALVVIIMLVLAWNNAFMVLWPIFGAGNQLLAALGLAAISAWLIRRKKPSWFTIAPGIFMFVTTLAALFYLLFKTYIPKANWTLIIADALLILLAIGTVVLSIISARKPASPEPEKALAGS